MSLSLDQKRPPAPLFTSRRDRLRAIPQAGPRVSWRSTRSNRRVGGTCWCIASANRSRLSPQRRQTSARRASRAMADGSRTSPTRQDGMRCTWRRLDRADEAMQMTKTGATEPVWAREGLFYREGERVMLRALESGILGEPQRTLRGTFRARSRRKPRVVRRRSSGPVFHHVEERTAAERVASGEKLGDGVTVVPSASPAFPVRGGALKRKRIFVQKKTASRFQRPPRTRNRNRNLFIRFQQHSARAQVRTPHADFDL